MFKLSAADIEHALRLLESEGPAAMYDFGSAIGGWLSF